MPHRSLAVAVALFLGLALLEGCSQSATSRQGTGGVAGGSGGVAGRDGLPASGGRLAATGGQSGTGGAGPGTGGADVIGTGGNVADAGADAGAPGADGPVDAPAPLDGGAGGAGGSGALCMQALTEPYSISIAGAWDFTPQGGARTKIQVPGGGWIKQGFTAPSATYATTLLVPNSGAPQTTLLEFGAINHQAVLTVDGRMVGTNMTAFTPSVFDISRFVTAGQPAALSLVVSGRDAFKTAAGARLVPVAANWSPNVPQGIFRSAMVRVYPDVYVSDVYVRTSVTSKTLTYDVWITNSGTTARQVTLSGALDSWNCDPLVYPSIPNTTVSVAAGASTKVTVGPIAWSLGAPSYWWPNVPYQDGYKAKLHNLRVSITEAGKMIHAKVVRFGFRESEQRRADAQHVYYYLNGVRVNFRGDSLQGVDYDSISTGTGRGDAYDTFPGFLPPSAGNLGWPQAVRNYQRLNYNVIRVHQEPAAPYMLDVTDELGLMIIDESAIRGTDGQDFVAGHDNMVNHLRALVLRDRNHPSIIRWSMSNEPNLSATDSVQFATDLYNAITALDPTRPVSTDVAGNGQLYPTLTFPNFSAFGHYLPGLGVYTDEVAARTDRPFGQGEFVWPKDVTRQGFMWFATGGMGMRAKDASEIRPYTLLSAWASVVPGVTTTMMQLEPTYPEGVINPPLFGENNLPDPWSNGIVMRVQRAFHPVLVADQAYWDGNKMSNANGDWPSAIPALALNADSLRNLLIFNDTFAGTSITVTWEVHAGTATGAIASMGTFTLDVPLGSRLTRPITVHTPATGTSCYLVLRAQKGGVTVFDDSAEVFSLN